MKLTLEHTLRYTLGSPARAVQHLLLTPLATPQQGIESWSITGPGLETATTFRDGCGNRAHLVTLVKPEATIEIVVGGQVETFDRSGVLGRLDYDPSPTIFRRSTALAKHEATLTDGLSLEAGRVAFLHALMDRVHRADAGSSQTQSFDGATQSQSSTTGDGDKAHAFIGAARAFDVPARYVRGYLVEDGAARVHHWAEAWDEGLGWIGFDPTLNFCPATGHIRIACGLDASTTTPVRSVPAPGGEVEEILSIETDQDPST